MITLTRWNPAELHGPLLSDLLHRYRALLVPVENEQAMHVYEMHHVMAHPIIEISSGRGKNFTHCTCKRVKLAR